MRHGVGWSQHQLVCLKFNSSSEARVTPMKSKAPHMMSAKSEEIRAGTDKARLFRSLKRIYFIIVNRLDISTLQRFF